jgi:hypothetical protein
MMTSETTVTRVEAIFDTEHGKANEGWYIRLHLSDGQERDAAQNWTRRTPSVQRVRKAARAEAAAWGFRMPRGIPVEVRGR